MENNANLEPVRQYVEDYLAGNNYSVYSPWPTSPKLDVKEYYDVPSLVREQGVEGVVSCFPEESQKNVGRFLDGVNENYLRLLDLYNQGDDLIDAVEDVFCITHDLREKFFLIGDIQVDQLPWSAFLCRFNPFRKLISSLGLALFILNESYDASVVEWFPENDDSLKEIAKGYLDVLPEEITYDNWLEFIELGEKMGLPKIDINSMKRMIDRRRKEK
jgi:hypothetical protein